MAVNIHITIIELNALHTKRQHLFQELDAVIHLLMEAKPWGVRQGRTAAGLDRRVQSLAPAHPNLLGGPFRRVVRAPLKEPAASPPPDTIHLAAADARRS